MSDKRRGYLLSKRSQGTGIEQQAKYAEWSNQGDPMAQRRALAELMVGLSADSPHREDLAGRIKRLGSSDKRTSNVESYKLTPEQIGFQRSFKKAKMVENLLRGVALQKMSEMNTIQELYKNLQISLDGIMKSAPVEPIRELQGMDFQEERNAIEQNPQKGMINY